VRIFILDREKITKFNLPEKISGIFIINYTPVNSKINRTINIEAQDNQWIVKSNDSINVISGNMILETAVLNEYGYQTMYIKDRKEYIGVYCLPNKDKDKARLKITKNQIIIGSGNDVSICYRSNLVLPKQAAIVLKDNDWYIQAVNDNEHFTFLNDQRVIESKLKIGDVIFIYGLKLIWMGDFFQINEPPGQTFINNFNLINYTEVHNQEDERIDPVSEEEMAIELYNENDYFFHTPRLFQSIKEEKVIIDAPPENQLQEDMPFLLTIGSTITMLSTSVMSGYQGIYGLASGKSDVGDVLPSLVMCGTMLVGSILMPRIVTLYQKNKRKKREKYRQEKYTKYLNDKENEINLKLINQAQILRSQNLSINECYSNAFSKNKALKWNREIRDEDFLTVRLGMGNTKAKLEIQAPQEKFKLDEDNLEQKAIEIVNKSHTLDNVPITISLTEKYISAFICKSTHNIDFLKGIFLQLLTYHSSQDLKLVFLISGENETYKFAKYAPHCLNEDKSIRFYGTTNEEIKKISAYLETEFVKRAKELIGHSEKNKDSELNQEIDKNKGYKNFMPYYLIITNNYMNVKNIPIISNIIKQQENLGFSLLIIDNSLQSLPNECNAFVEVEDKESCIIEKELNNQLRFNTEIMGGIDLRTVSNVLANIPTSMADQESQLPTSMTFLEMYNVAKIEQLNILNRWKNNDPTTSLKAPIGVHTSGELFNLDLHEKFHGPHGLIAGSTGSGKSEFIITYLLSMAVNYHPDEVQFVLIDYKGGGLAGAFENRETGVRIPHVVGTITNLDTSEMNRTLVSINSELKRRQKMFNDAKNETGESTIDIYKYQHYYREGVLKKPCSHLFIVSDEFAELKSQQPEFMNELISTARIGRSLGVHLILATQKPSGVVNDQIWSNTKFRICLKVQDRSDSMEVLKKPDAASIKETGRFYLQVGYDEYFDIGQSGWAGAKYIPSDTVIKKIDDSIKFIDNTGSVTKTVTEITKRKETVEKGDQLTNIVKHIVELSTAENYQPQRLWLEKIPAEIYVDDLKKKYNHTPIPYVIDVPIGEYDNPSEQLQGLLKLNLMKGNCLIYGTPDSGKENLLTTLIYSAITEHSTEEINFYILDFGSETLKAYKKAPHVGEVYTIGEDEKILNMFVMIDKELDKRKELFVDYAGNYENYIENSGEKLPLINIVINNYEVFSENLPKIADLITTMYRDALKYGISFTITTGAANSFKMRIAEFFSNKLCLQMATDTDYRNLLMCARGLIPAKISGRGISGIEDLKYEFQTAYISAPKDINQTIKNEIVELNKTNKTSARKVPVLPETVSIEHIISELKDLTKVPIGIEMDSKLPHIYNFAKDKTNIMIYDNIENNINFFFSLFKILKSLANVKVRIMDVNSSFDTTKIPVECFQKNFEGVLNAMTDEIVKNTYPNITRIYFINGISKLKEKIPKEKIELYNNFFKLIKESNNTILIVADEYNSYKLFQLETWYRNIFNTKRGIWLGKGIGSQLAFSITNMSMDIKNADYKDMAFIINNDEIIPIKKVVVDKEETEENEK